MAKINQNLLLVLIPFFTQTFAGIILNSVFEESLPCEDTCDKTYTLHTYEKAGDLACCKRGCRLFSIIDFIEEYCDVNSTIKSCESACKDAYKEGSGLDACKLGCNNQASFAQKKFPELDLFRSNMDMMSPFMYVHNMYSNMVDKFSSHMSVSWSFFMSSDNGQLIVVQSAPRLIRDNIFMDDDEYKTSNYMETNLEAADNSATPNVKHSQMQMSERDLDNQERILVQQAGDWLDCLSTKTGLPRLFLTFTIFLSSMMMIWLCLTAICGGQKETVIEKTPQKLSIYGDLDDIVEMTKSGKAPLMATLATDEQAPALPIKLQINSV